MSRIEKLSISGVRSFSPSVREAIQFNTPLTLIVGYNGSGKTTIIECLKYATTGELPPNSKGGAFINDPKLCGEKEVMAQVKLQFRSTNDRQHVATRSLQLTVQKASRSQKTLDCSLVVVNNGERTTTSTRLAQLDEMIPERLGVSPAILDAVIFCHQDESLWPLSEPAALKKRFDEIFEALKFTKVIENLKLLRKKQMEELKQLQNDEAHNKINKDRGERAEQQMLALQTEIDAYRDKCTAISHEQKELQEKIKEIREQANSFIDIVHDLKNKRDQFVFRQDAVNELRPNIEELHEDDASLEESLAHYEGRMLQLQEEGERNKAQYNELQTELSQLRQALSSKHADHGKHQSNKDKYERQLKVRVEMIQEAAQSHDFSGYDGDITGTHVKSFHDRIQKLLNEKKRDLERLQNENSAELDEATGVITELVGRQSARVQDRLSAKQRLGAIEKRIGILNNESSIIDVDEGAKAILDAQMEDLEGRFSSAQKAVNNSAFDRQILEGNDKLHQLESENEKLNRELMECTRLASERAQLDYRKKELADRTRKLDALTSAWSAKLSSAIGGEWKPETLDSQWHTILKSQAKKVADAQKRRDQTRQKQQKVEFRLRTARESLEKDSKEAADCQKQVVEALQVVRDNATVEDYIEEVGAVEQQVEDLRNELSLFDALVDYYNKCKRMLESKKKCLLCERHFDDSQAASLERLGKKIEKNLDPKGKIDVEKDIKESMVSLEKLRSVRSVYDTYGRLSAKLPARREECKTVEAEHDDLERQLEKQSSAVSVEEEQQKDLEDMSKTVASISQLVKEIKDAETQVERIMSQQTSGNATRSSEEINELQSNLADQLKSLRNRISTLTNDRQRMRDQLNSLELEKSELRNKINRTAGQLDKKKDLQTQLQNLKDDQVLQRQAIQRADAELGTIEPSISEAKSARDEVLERGRSKEKTIIDVRDAVANSADKLRLMNAEIQHYIDSGGPTNLASNQRAIDNLEKSIATAEREITELTVRTNKLKQDIDNGDRKKKNIHDNLLYRKHLRTLEKLRQDISELEDRNADEDYQNLQNEARSLEIHRNRLVAEEGSFLGSMKTKDEELARLIQVWEIDYRDAKRQYRESHIRVETTKAAIEDLVQCTSAVEKAVIKFHGLKMAEVNRIAGELWQSTYQGTDIDTILIRSENETTANNKKYNYRLCMVKQGTEMDMRGRCSAGQKVLASIIIRLALAESFGVNCGLIALDEPTTNLDRDNIKSLAESLHMIIKTRQAQSNFQLIVITHDEEFLRHMRCSDFCDSFFRVRRDEKQNSVISRESITKIF